MLIAATAAMACTNFIVGKKASADGSVICSYNADSYGAFMYLYHYPAAKHQSGDMRKIYEWDTNKYLGEIPEAAETYNVIGNINEWQVTIGETTFGGREEMVDTTGIIDYGSLIYIALQRSKTAREAIGIMTSLVEKYGYCSEGETFTICDPNEAWIMEMMGAWVSDSLKATLKPAQLKQLGRTVWVARRIPDDMICGHANQSRITTFMPAKKEKKGEETVLWSKNVVSYARLMGWYDGKNDADFSYNAAYAKPDFSGRRICDARVWQFFNRYADGMDRYIPWAEGRDANAEVMPLWVKPNKLLTVQDVQAAMRDHFEGTPFDVSDQSQDKNDIGGGIWQMPYRVTPLYFEIDGKKHQVSAKEHPEYLKCETVEDMANMERLIAGEPYVYNGDRIKEMFKPSIREIKFVDGYNKQVSTRDAQGNLMNVIGVDKGAFSGCINLEKVTLPASIVQLGMNVFKDCKKVHITTPRYPDRPFRYWPSDAEFYQEHLFYEDGEHALKAPKKPEGESGN